MSWQLGLERTLASLSGMSPCFPPHILLICRKDPETSTSIQARTDWLTPPLPRRETKVDIGESRVLTITMTMEIGGQRSASYHGSAVETGRKDFIWVTVSNHSFIGYPPATLTFTTTTA